MVFDLVVFPVWPQDEVHNTAASSASIFSSPSLTPFLCSVTGAAFPCPESSGEARRHAPCACGEVPGKVKSPSQVLPGPGLCSEEGREVRCEVESVHT